ncbi:MAG TPA: insulinase family protein, partial [Armatimonadota bacterium]
MTCRTPLVALCVLLTSACRVTWAEAQPLSPAEPPAVRAEMLPNGLRLIVKEDHSLPLAALELWVRSGTGSEAEGQHGALHLLEHLAFKKRAGSAARPDEVIENLGATLEAATSKDWVRFHTTVPAAAVDAALRILAEVASPPAIEAADLDRERAVIAQEMVRTLSEPLDALLLRLASEAMTGPYARPSVGTPQD